MRKNFRTILLLLIITTVMWIFTGCGDKEQIGNVSKTEQTAGQPEQSANADEVDDVTGEANTTDEQTDQISNKEEPIQNESVDESLDKATDGSQAPDATEGDNSTEAPETSAGTTEELSIHVESIGDNSVVGNKIFIEPGVVEGSEIAVVGVGVDNKALLSVYFDDNVSYVYRIIRDGGANVETYDGSFSDIKEGFILNMTGRYEGEDFRAEEVEIHDVRND